MKAQDLRIGNLVMTDVEKGSAFDGLNFVVGWSEIRDSEILGDNWGYKPIPLTEEWLERFGFEYSDLNGDSGLWKIPPFQIYGKYNQFIYDYRLDVNYVHQLQNLYFALTYEELQTDESDKKVNQ